MELTNEFEVAVPVERAWAVLTDLERIAPCLPGAQLREVQGDEFRGSVKIKVGPITTSYDGVISFTELDQSAHRAVLRAEGRETRGQGNVAAVMTATMVSTGVGTKVEVSTDLTVTGKVAQFGRGVLADVSAKLLDQFVVNLESTVLTPEGADAPPSSAPHDSDATGAAPTKERTSTPTTPSAPVDDPEPSAGEVRQIDSEPAEPVDLFEIAGGSVARRVLRPLVIAGVVLAVVVRRVRRRRG